MSDTGLILLVIGANFMAQSIALFYLVRQVHGIAVILAEFRVEDLKRRIAQLTKEKDAP